MNMISSFHPWSRIAAWLSAIVVVTMLATGPASSQGDGADDYRGRAVWTATNLDLKIDLTPDRPTYQGTMTLRAEGNVTDGPVLILNNIDASMEMRELKAWSSDGSEAASRIEMALKNPGGSPATLYAVHLDKAGLMAREITISFRYEFVREQGQVLQRDQFSYASWVTAWYPSPIAPADDLIAREKLAIPGTTSFVIRDNWNALSNGKLIEDRQDGDKRVQTWRVGPDVARSYVAAPYKVTSVRQGDVDIRMYMLNSEKSGIEAKVAQFAKIVGILSEKFGDYPYDTFALAEMPNKTTDYFGASSEQGFIVAESKNFAGDAGIPLFAHELAHSWWGNLFQCSGKGSTLCDEALAQMGAILAVEELFGKDALKDFLDVSTPDFTNYASARGYFSLLRSGKDIAINELESDWRVHRLMDSKGMWFWQMLRLEMGDNRFFDALQQLSRQDHDLTLDELEGFFSARAEKDLGYFFDQWLGRTGAPILSMEWQNPISSTHWDYFDIDVEALVTGESEAKQRIDITIVQEQALPYRLTLPIEIRLYNGQSIVKTVELTDKQGRYTFEIDGLVKDVALDPDHRILMWRPAYGPKPAGS